MLSAVRAVGLAAGLVVGLAGSLVVGVVGAAPSGVSTSARATQSAVRSATQTQVVPPAAPSTARYRVTINIGFNSITHPGLAPVGAHVSDPVIATHGAPGAMFAVGEFASAGIESMAERGLTAPLLAELRADPSVREATTTDGVTGVGTRSVELQLEQSADLLSLVTMLAPSPDWFIGFADLDLFVDGAWAVRVELPLGSYDAGTDSGSRFVSNDADTQPRQPIAGPGDAEFVSAAAQQPFGTVVIARID